MPTWPGEFLTYFWLILNSIPQFMHLFLFILMYLLSRHLSIIRWLAIFFSPFFQGGEMRFNILGINPHLLPYPDLPKNVSV